MNEEHLARILLDLDRCEHGRHQGDSCVDCPSGRSEGNPHIRPGQVIGFDRGGDLIVMPDRRDKTDPAAWHAPRTGGAV